MGIEILWFMPITPISKIGRLGTLGSYYACSDYMNTNPEFGTMEDFQWLVDQAHEFGFKVLIDWVANHTGWDHVWTTEHPEFYRKNTDGHFYDAHGWADVIDLNYDSPELQIGHDRGHAVLGGNLPDRWISLRYGHAGSAGFLERSENHPGSD